jgi:hypothetical protein
LTLRAKENALTGQHGRGTGLLVHEQGMPPVPPGGGQDRRRLGRSADALKQEHESLATETRTSLAQATANAAKTAATARIPVCSTAHLKDLASAAARVFGWESKQPQVQLNQLVITLSSWTRFGRCG